MMITALIVVAAIIALIWVTIELKRESGLPNSAHFHDSGILSQFEDGSELEY